MNEATDPQSLEQVEAMKGPHTRLVQCVVGWGDCPRRARHPVRAPGASLGIYGFAKPGPNSLPLPVAEYRDRPIASFQGNDRNIAVLARAFNGMPLGDRGAAETGRQHPLAPDTVNVNGHSPVVMDNQIGHWGNPHDSVGWVVNLHQPGRFDVRVEYACEKLLGGSTFIVNVGPRAGDGLRRHRILAQLPDHHGGTRGVCQAGRQTITVPPTDKTPWKAISLKSITLTPVREFGPSP